MNILLISQCNKRALVETRRVLDQFAERKGERTWQTAITLQGLQTLRKMLKKSARRNTAVACHRIGGKNYSELLWVVGNANKFNIEGTIPTNFTRRDVLKADDENQWYTATIIALLSALAALFHDFGKANVLFQDKLKKGKRATEPYRHEWVSLRMFEAFVRGEPDEQWLQRLANVSSSDEQSLLDRLKAIQDHPDTVIDSPFKSLKPLAQAVGWLILTHHKLPQTPKEEKGRLKHIAYFLSRHLQPDWNSSRERWVKGERKEWAGADEEVGQVWTFPDGTPLRSSTWCKKARNIAQRLAQPGIFDSSDSSWDNDFVMHVARMTLMLADHYYSSQDRDPRYGDDGYKVYANTDKDGNRKQQLDEHLVGVYKHSLRIMRILPGLRNTLPALGRHAAFKKRTRDSRFLWQNKAYELACSLKDKAQEGGFFGVNMASTGCGKTFANARIMYALADEKRGCRFSVALGLRTLTLQTGDAFRQRMLLDEDDMAVMIGSAAVRKLHEDQVAEKEKEEQEKPDRFTGSESAEALDDDYYIIYDEALADTALKRWLKASPKADRMVGAPILVSTIDHLMPATEGTRGGRQIAPMLRLLTSDLVIDEPDDFSLDDLKALTRLVHWAGMLGSKVVLSSATLSPALLTGLFQAYHIGRTVYNKNCGNPNQETIYCAWFDEKKAEPAAIANVEEFRANVEKFRQQHSTFTKDRAAELATGHPKRKAEIVSLTGSVLTPQDAVNVMSEKILEGIHRLHSDHSQEDPKTKKRISVGLVRMANINPLVSVAQRLLEKEPPADTTVHYCVYHSRFPLIVRSEIERILDTVLTRKDGKELWQSSVIQEAIARAATTNHIFVVIASPVAEIGRDHDYDWAVVEPSSMRSLVQIGGRVLRHRDRLPETVNMLLLSKNYRGLTGKRPAFCRPGFESDDRRLTRYDLADLLCEDQYTVIDSRPCIVPRENFDPTQNLADMEHRETDLAFSSPDQSDPYASQWIKSRATLTGELQKRTPFRKSAKEDDYFLHLGEGDEEPTVRKWHGDGPYKEAKDCDEINLTELSIDSGNRIWGHVAYSDALNRLAQKEGKDVEELGKTYGTFSLRPARIGWPWQYTPKIGFYEPMKK